MDISFTETLSITFISMLIVFGTLILIMGVIMLFRFLPQEDPTPVVKKPVKYIPFEEMDEDMKVAVLVATIDAQQEYNQEVVLKSVRKIEG